MIVLETLGRRWYAFAFLIPLFFSASATVGWKRALRFYAVACVAQAAAELSSTRNGFPFGEYRYVARTRGDELYLSNVPLFVPLTFGVVVWAGRDLARLALPNARRFALVLPGAIAAAVLDLIIDPMTLRGGEWFLGELYTYEAGSAFFDVPWSNLGGWLLVSAFILVADAALARSEPEGAAPARRVLLPGSIAGFFVLLAFATGNPAIGSTGLGIAAALAAAALVSRRRAGVAAAA